ncbi:MAG: hypothetical protein ACOX2F_02855 [bacterium]
MSDSNRLKTALEIPLIFDTRHYCVDELKNKELLYNVRNICSSFGHNFLISNYGHRSYREMFKKFHKDEKDFFVSIYSFLRVPVCDPEACDFAGINSEDHRFFYIDKLLKKHTENAVNSGIQSFNKSLFFIHGEESPVLVYIKKAIKNNNTIKNSELHCKLINRHSDLITVIIVSTIGQLQGGYYPIETKKDLSDIEIIDFLIKFKGQQQLGAEPLESKYIETIKRCAKENHPDAVFLLGFCYFSGRGVPKNPEYGMKLIETAAYKGNLPAIEFISLLRGLNENG